mgnify:CR=1 FL=1
MSERLYEITEITDLKDMLKKSGEKYGEKIAYKIRQENGYKEITHNEVRKMVDGLGTKLIDMGLKDKRIAGIGENRYEWGVAYLATVTGTGVVVPLDKALPENEIESLIIRSEVEAIFYSKKYDEIMAKIQEKGNTKFGKIKINPDEMKILLFTSVTTTLFPFAKILFSVLSVFSITNLVVLSFGSFAK